MGTVVDSSAGIRVEREWRVAGDDVLAQLPADSFVAAITVSEMLVGVLQSRTAEQRRTAEAFLDVLLAHVPVLAFGEKEAREHARLHVLLRRAGTMIGAADLEIAATALANGHNVMTGNVSEFSRVPGLIVRSAP